MSGPVVRRVKSSWRGSLGSTVPFEMQFQVFFLMNSKLNSNTGQHRQKERGGSGQKEQSRSYPVAGLRQDSP